MSNRAIAVVQAVGFNGDGSYSLTVAYSVATYDDVTGNLVGSILGATATVPVAFGLDASETDRVLRAGTSAGIAAGSSLLVHPDNIYFPMSADSGLPVA